MEIGVIDAIVHIFCVSCQCGFILFSSVHIRCCFVRIIRIEAVDRRKLVGVRI